MPPEVLPRPTSFVIINVRVYCRFPVIFLKITNVLAIFHTWVIQLRWNRIQFHRKIKFLSRERAHRLKAYVRIDFLS